MAVSEHWYQSHNLSVEILGGRMVVAVLAYLVLAIAVLGALSPRKGKR